MIKLYPASFNFPLFKNFQPVALALRAIVVMALVIGLFAVGCQSEEAKGAVDAKEKLSAAVQESDTLFARLFEVQQTFHQLKAKMNEAPEALKQSPKFLSLQNRLQGAIIKSGVFYDQVDATKKKAQDALAQHAEGKLTGGMLDAELKAIESSLAESRNVIKIFNEVSKLSYNEYEEIAGAGK